jgi:hypothetical protein
MEELKNKPKYLHRLLEATFILVNTFDFTLVSKHKFKKTSTLGYNTLQLKDSTSHLKEKRPIIDFCISKIFKIIRHNNDVDRCIQ